MDRCAGRTLVVLLLVPLAGCGTSLLGGPACPMATAAAPARTLAAPEVTRAPEGRADLGVDVVSSREEPLRVTVEVGGRLALDAEIPGSDTDCAHQPIHRHTFALREGRYDVVVTSDRGERDAAEVRVGRGVRWLVVQPQTGFPLDVEVYDEVPGWG